MFPQPRFPARQPRVHPPLLPPKQPFRFHPSCVLALLPQQDPVWFDYSDYDNHGILHGPTPTAEGRYGFAWSFDGADDRIRVPHSPSLDLTNAGTILALLKPNPGFGEIYPRIVFKMLAYDLVVNLEGRPVLHLRTGGIDHPLPAQTLLSPTSWAQITVHWDISFPDNQLRMYLNRKLDNQRELPSPADTVVHDLFIGDVGTGARVFNGLIARALLYNQAWSPNPADPNYLPEIDPGPPPYDW